VSMFRQRLGFKLDLQAQECLLLDRSPRHWRKRLSQVGCTKGLASEREKWFPKLRSGAGCDVTKMGFPQNMIACYGDAQGFPIALSTLTLAYLFLQSGRNVMCDAITLVD
jgi:hypothetical protein